MDDNELCRYIKLYHQTVYRAAFSYLHNVTETEDIVQDTFVRLFETNKHFTSDEHCKAWLIKVAINLSKNLLKSFRYTHTEELNETILFEDNKELGLAQAISELPPRYRAVIHLFYFEGYSSKEIAEILGLTVSVVTTRLSRAREKLRKLMTADENPTIKKTLTLRRGNNERGIQ